MILIITATIIIIIITTATTTTIIIITTTTTTTTIIIIITTTVNNNRRVIRLTLISILHLLPTAISMITSSSLQHSADLFIEEPNWTASLSFYCRLLVWVRFFFCCCFVVAENDRSTVLLGLLLPRLPIRPCLTCG